MLEKQYITSDAIEAEYIAPYYGRMEEAGLDAFQHLRQMKHFATYSTNGCKILVASIRSVEQMITLAAQGHLYFTIAPRIAEELINNELTKLLKIEGYKKKVNKILQLKKIEICAVLFFTDSKVITLSSK